MTKSEKKKIRSIKEHLISASQFARKDNGLVKDNNKAIVLLLHNQIVDIEQLLEESDAK